MYVLAAPKGFTSVEDAQDAYKFLYPFGWQEVAVLGADVVYKDVVEPLESVSVTLTATDKNDITEFGELQSVRDRCGMWVDIRAVLRNGLADPWAFPAALQLVHGTSRWGNERVLYASGYAPVSVVL